MRLHRLALAWLLGMALLGITAAALNAWWRGADHPIPPTPEKAAFELVTHRGDPVTEADFAGAWLLVFFGFTHCADVCPSSLATQARVLEKLGTAAPQLQPLMITVDPARDTPDVLAEYVTYFHPRIVGLTGSETRVREATERFRVYHDKGPASTDGTYEVAHSEFLYLINPEGEFAAMYPHGTGAEAIADDIGRQLSEAE